MVEYKIVTASDDLPGAATVVDEHGKSILAVYNGTPIFHDRAVADRVVAMLNEQRSWDATGGRND